MIGSCRIFSGNIRYRTLPGRRPTAIRRPLLRKLTHPVRAINRHFDERTTISFPPPDQKDLPELAVAVAADALPPIWKGDRRP